MILRTVAYSLLLHIGALLLCIAQCLLHILHMPCMHTNLSSKVGLQFQRLCIVDDRPRHCYTNSVVPA